MRLSIYLVFFSCVIVVGSLASYGVKDYQDSWILAGLEIPVFLLSVAYSWCFVARGDISLGPFVVLSCVWTAMLNCLPSLKYQYPVGVTDELFHYRFALDLLDSGRVPSGFIYSDFPCVHVLMASVSSVSNLPFLWVFKLALPLAWSILPAVAYMLSRRVFGQSEVTRCVVFASAVPWTAKYYVIGTSFPSLLLVMIVALLVIRLSPEAEKIRRRIFALTVLMTEAIVLSHVPTPFIVSVGLLGTFFLIRFLSATVSALRLIARKVCAPLLSLVAVFTTSFVAYWMLVSTGTFRDFIGTIYRYIVLFQESPKAVIPERFFAISAASQIRLVILVYIGDAIACFLILMGILYVLRDDELRRTPGVSVLTFLVLSLGALIGLQFALNLGILEIYRTLWYVTTVGSPLAGVVVYLVVRRAGRTRVIRYTLSVICFSLLLILPSFISFYGFQPLVPRVPQGYILEIGNVNSIYQRNLVAFLEMHVPLSSSIACDKITRNQIFGFASSSFSSSVLISYGMPPEYLGLKSPDGSSRFGEFRAGYLALHRPGRSGRISEPVEFRDLNLTVQAIRRSGRNLVFNNGDSFLDHLVDGKA